VLTGHDLKSKHCSLADVAQLFEVKLTRKNGTGNNSTGNNGTNRKVGENGKFCTCFIKDEKSTHPLASRKFI